MQYIYFGTVFAAMIVFLLSSLLLFSQRKKGERSRTLFACINLISVLNYINQIINFEQNAAPFVVMPVPLLLLGIFVLTTYIMYPIEVISPGWLNWKRVLTIYIPVVCLCGFYKLTRWAGVVYTPFDSMAELSQQIGSFEVLFRIVLALLFFLPALLLYFLPYTRKYNNADHKWLRGYVITVIINTVAVLVVLNSCNMVVRTLYYVVSVSCSMYLVYQELFVRLIRESQEELSMQPEVEPYIQAEPVVLLEQNHKTGLLFAKLEQYINQNQLWRNPDLSVNELTRPLATNRTYLRETIHQQGYESYTTYINRKRINEFIQIIQQQGGGNFSQIFYDVGFRSKATALRNFRKFTGMTPSEYLHQSAGQNPRIALHNDV